MPVGRTPAAGLRVPLLAGVETRATLGDAQWYRTRMARAMVEAGVAVADRWEAPEVGAFLEASLGAWVKRHGSDVIDRRFDLTAFFTPELDQFYAEHLTSGKSVEAIERSFLCLDASSAGAIYVGPLVDWLAPFHHRLTATVYDALLEGLNVLRYYGTWDADEFFQMRMDGMDEQDIATDDLPSREVPAALRRKALSDRALARLLATAGRCWPEDVRAAVEAARALAAMGRAAKRDLTRQDSELRAELCGDLGMPVPAMVVAIEPHDFVFAAFDEESQWMLDQTPEPNAWWMIRAARAADVRVAFDGLAARLQVLAAATKLMDFFPKARAGVIPKKLRSRTRVRVGAGGQPEGRPLAAVLVDAFGERDDDWAYEIAADEMEGAA